MRFSDFLLVGDPSDLDFIVGYKGDQNIRIDVTDFVNGFITGSGTTGYVPLFDSFNNIVDSSIYQDGSNIVIGGQDSLDYKLAVTGSFYVSDGAVIDITNSGADALRIVADDGNIFIVPNDLGQSISSLRRIIHPPAIITTESATLGQVNTAISNLEDDIEILLDLKVDKTSIGVPNGVASLDSGGKVPLSQIPDSIIGQVQYMGTWNAFTNTPTLNPLVPEERGHYYVVSAAGVFGGVDYAIGDWIISNGVIWEKVDNTDAVTSVFGRIGAILALEGDYQSFYPRLSQAYDNPTWINSLAFSKITSVPAFLLENQTITLSGDVTGSGKTSISSTISNNAVSNEKLRDSVGTSVIGRSASSTGDPADIQASTDGHVLLRSAGNLLFGLISGDSISSIDWSKITGTPSTLSGYGITDAYTKTESDNKFVPYTGANANVNLGSNNITANSFIKSGGTSAQFLKADGSVDTSQYVPTTRSVNAGTGLTGGGNLSSDVTIAFDTTWGDNRYAYRTRQLTINGTTFDLSADRTWNVGTTTGTGTSGQVAFWDGTSSQTGDNGLFWDNTNKRLGVGTNAPTTRLDVIGTHIGSIGLIRLRSSTTSEICAQTYYQSTAYRAATFVDISSNFNIWTRGSSSIIFATNDTLTEQARISSVGNLLLNTTTDAGFRLDVNGTARVQGNLNVSTGGITLTGAQTIQTSTGNLTLTSADNTGVVDIRRNDQRNGAELRLTNSFNGTSWLVNDVVGTLNFVSADTTTTQPIRSQIRAISLGGITFPSLMGLTFSTANGDTLTEGFRLTNTSNLLVGTTTDAGFRLDVNGTARVQGEFTVGNGTDSIIRANSSVISSFQTTTLQASTANISTMLDIRPNGSSSSLTGFYLRDSSTAANGSNIVIVGRGNATLPSTGVTYLGALISGVPSANSLHLGFLVSNTSAGRIEAARIWNSGNVSIQAGGTYTDSGFRLDVNGQGRFKPLTNGAIILGSPDSTNGIVISANSATAERFDIRRYANRVSFLAHSASTAPGEPSGIILFNTGNVSLNTTTDAGFRLDVNGTARVQGNLNVSTGGVTLTGAQTIQTSTGNLTLATAGGDGNILLAPNGTGVAGDFRVLGRFVAGAQNGTGDSHFGSSGIGGTPTFGGQDYGSYMSHNAFRQSDGAWKHSRVTTIGASKIQVVGGGSNGLAGGFYFDYSPNVGSSNISWSTLMYLTSTGNLLLNTITDAGFRLDVQGSTRFNGLSTIQGTTASDSGQLGAELTTTGSGTNWTGTSFATGYTHAVGSTVPLSTSLVATNGTYYQITYTVTGRTAGSITISYGGVSTSGITATGATGPRAISTVPLSIVPTTDFDGTLVLSIKVISTSSASVTFNSSAGTTTNQIRISSINSNTFVGRESGRNNTTATANSFFGAGSGQSNTTGGNNSFFGNASGQANITGVLNSFFGSSSGRDNTTGTNNSFFGIASGQSNTTGNNNTGNGSSSLLSNTTGGNNTATGLNAIFANTTGSNNTSSGVQSLQNNITGSNNIAIGVSAGRFAGTGTTNMTSVNNSIYLGFQTRGLNATGSTNEVVIGYDVVGLGSNTTVLGNTSTTFGRWFGNLLVGTSTNNGTNLRVVGTTQSDTITQNLASHGVKVLQYTSVSSTTINLPTEFPLMTGLVVANSYAVFGKFLGKYVSYGQAIEFYISKNPNGFWNTVAYSNSSQFMAALVSVTGSGDDITITTNTGTSFILELTVMTQS